jgi:protein involved in polysaccharide export with SLBB domain
MLHVRVEGEVKNPGLLLLPPGTHLQQAVEQAGGLSVGAFIFGTVLTRPSVRREQEVQLEKARREVRRAIALASTQPAASAEEALAVQRQLDISKTLLEESTQAVPSGRIVLGIKPTDAFLPLFPLQDGDTIFIPPIPQVVGVFGSVVNPGVFEFRNYPTSKEVIDVAGGLSYGADEKRTFVISANGQTSAAKPDQLLWFTNAGHKPLNLLPGDTVYVPDDLEPKFNLVRELKDWTGILSQFVTGAAAIKILQE